MKTVVSNLTILLLLNLIRPFQTVNLSDLQSQVNLQWSFVSQIQHTWFKNIINSHFQACTEHKQFKALYNCQTTIDRYRIFWKQFIQGIEQIKFRKALQQGDHSWSYLMIEAAEEWITVNKTKDTIEIQQLYQDISEFPDNLMYFAQWTTHQKDIFDDMKELINWQRTEKAYLNKRDRSDDEIKQDQSVLLRKFLNPNCFMSEQSLETCTIPLYRYTYYLKACFFYYFDQPEKFSRYDNQTRSMIINPVLDYKITKLWRDMRPVMKEHLKMGEQVTLDQIEKLTPDILESVMESLVRRTTAGGQKSKKQSEETGKQAEL